MDETGLFAFNCFCNNIEDVHVGANKTGSLALNTGAELVLEKRTSVGLLVWSKLKGVGDERSMEVRNM